MRVWEDTGHVREEEHHNKENEQKHAYTHQIMHGVVRVERNTVFRNAVFVFVLLDVDAIRVVRTHFVQCQDVQHYQPKQNDRQSHNVQSEEAVQGNTRDQVITTNPQRQVFTNHRNSTKQVHDNLRAPIGHLSPREQVSHEGFSHQHQVNQHAKQPD